MEKPRKKEANVKVLNVVRMKVKAGFENQFVEYHRKLRPGFKGFLGGTLVSTGDRTFCLIGEWRSSKHLAAARPELIATLDGVRDLLEDLGGGLGVTDPVSGEVATKLAAAKPRKAKKAAKAAKKAEKKAERKAAKAAKKPARKGAKVAARKAASKKKAASKRSR